MNCSFCGYGLAPDDTVCGQCGQAVTFEAVLPVHPADVPVLLTPTNAFPPVRLRPHNSRLAWTALLLGILSPVTLGLTALPAIICAVIALWRIRRLGWLLRGRELAFNGLVIGALGLLVPLVIVPDGRTPNLQLENNAKIDVVATFSVVREFTLFILRSRSPSHDRRQLSV